MFPSHFLRQIWSKRNFYIRRKMAFGRLKYVHITNAQLTLFYVLPSEITIVATYQSQVVLKRKLDQSESICLWECLLLIGSMKSHCYGHCCVCFRIKKTQYQAFRLLSDCPHTVAYISKQPQFRHSLTRGLIKK